MTLAAYLQGKSIVHRNVNMSLLKSSFQNSPIIIYLVCSNTMCVSTCQVEFVYRELSLL